MKNNCRQILVLSSFLILGSSVYAVSADAHVGKNVAGVADTVPVVKAAVTLDGIITPKQLKDPVMKLLDLVWSKKPYVLLRIDCSMRSIKEVLVKMQLRREAAVIKPSTQEEDLQFIKAETGKMLEPVKKFFEDIIEYAERVKPLVKESLLRIDYPEKDILLMQYFSIKNGDLYVFVDQTVTSLDKFEKICLEFWQLFADMKESLRPETKDIYVQFLKEIERKRQAATQQRVARG